MIGCGVSSENRTLMIENYGYFLFDCLIFIIMHFFIL